MNDFFEYIVGTESEKDEIKSEEILYKEKEKLITEKKCKKEDDDMTCCEKISYFFKLLFDCLGRC